MNVKLEDITENAEAKMIRIARVSNPGNQDNPEYVPLIRYCIKHGHWSVFEHAHMTLEITTSLAIATQILRHRSFTFQQLSARYQNPFDVGLAFETLHFRKQSDKNRQSSVEPLNAEEFRQAYEISEKLLEKCRETYLELIKIGVARECARMVLPQATQTTMYMTGNIRSWIHYLDLRTQENVQWEHQVVALLARQIFQEHLPVISAAMGWPQ